MTEKKHMAAGRKYTREDDEKLEFLYKAGKTINDLSEIFGRSEASIKDRLKKLCLSDADVKFVCKSMEASK